MAYLVPRSELEKLCIRYRATAAKDFYVGKDITRDKELVARKQLKVPATSSLVAVLDTTVLKTMEYGLAICEEGIFWVSSAVTRTRRNRFLWDEFIATQISRSDMMSTSLGMNVEFGEGSTLSNGTSDFPTASLVELLQIMQVVAAKHLPESVVATAIQENGLPRSRVGWSLSLNGSIIGPFDAQTIKLLVQFDTVDPATTLAWKDGMKEWQPLSQMERLQPREQPLPPPLPGQVSMPKPAASPARSGTTPRTFFGTPADLVDVNNASTSELLTLPCMNVERVRMIEAYRKQHEALATVEDVGRICSLKPHEVEKLRSRVSFSSVGNQQTASSAGKRVVDF